MQSNNPVFRRAEGFNGRNAQGNVVTWLRGIDHDSSLQTRPGWDNVTGLGSPSAPALIDRLS